MTAILASLPPLPWRATVAAWPPALRREWAALATSLEDAGLHWDQAERLALVEIALTQPDPAALLFGPQPPRTPPVVELVVHCDACGQRILDGRTLLCVEAGPLRSRRESIDLCPTCCEALVVWLAGGPAPHPPILAIAQEVS